MLFTDDQLSNIPYVLSPPRFATYLKHSQGNRAAALKLYQWNVQISSAFLIPLHFLEVSIRNAVVDRLDVVHTPNWPWNQGFIKSLPSTKGYSPQKNLEQVAYRQNTSGKVVADLKFVFWEKMFTARHDERLWINHIKHLFPNTGSGMTDSKIRESIYNDLFVIRQLRNRIAHHEPIFQRNIQEDYEKMFKLIYWRDATTANWMNSMQYVTQLLSEEMN
ncbi:MAG: hypothetical protein V4629_06070 [Pseudomonadota bacterium]